MAYPTGNLIPLNAGGLSTKLAISTSSAQSPVYTSFGPIYLNVYTDTDCFARFGVNPTADSSGIDQIILAGPLYRIGPVPSGQRLAFITASGSGFIYLTPEN